MTKEEQKQLIDKVCDWLKTNYHEYDHRDEFDIVGLVNDLKYDFTSDNNDERPEYGELIYRCGKKPRWNVGDTLSYHECNVLYEGELDLGKVIDIYFKDSLNDWMYVIDEDGVRRICSEKELLEDKVYKQENATEEQAMPQEEKDLLLKDLCSRMPYGVL